MRERGRESEQQTHTHTHTPVADLRGYPKFCDI